jgi:putative heme-binding domain-containing protein
VLLAVLSAGSASLANDKGVNQHEGAPPMGADTDSAEAAALRTARGLLAIGPRPARPPLPDGPLPLEVIDGERIALVGNSTAERMNLFGHFEALLHQRFPSKRLAVRNFARPADEVGNRQRPNDYTKLDDPMAAFGADTYLLFFGFNESFGGPAAVETFKAHYAELIREFRTNYPRDDTKALPRIIVVSPIAVEPTGDPLLPDAVAQNAALALYRDAARSVAAAERLPFIDLFDVTLAAFSAEPGRQFTINGCHVDEAGDRVVGEALDRALFGAAPAARLGAEAFARLRAAVNDKSWVHLQDYRMVNGWYAYGSNRTWDTETFPREYVKLRNMAAVRDRRIWQLAAGRPVADVVDDSDTGELVAPPSRFGDPRLVYMEDQKRGPEILSPEGFMETCTLPPGFEVRLFADERTFPEIAKPVQLAFDSRGRLWVATMPSYPQWRPGDPPPADKLVILEDTDGDERADKRTVFYDRLHCPTGFQFFAGGVLVVDQPRLLWLRDTDGDDRADAVVHVLDGWGTDDTHHTAGAFEMSHGGLLHALEGPGMSTTLETPWGPFRNSGTPGCYVIDPRTWKVRHFKTPGYGNPWCYVFDEWGQGIVGDGTMGPQHWDTPLSGAQYPGRKGMNPVFDTEKMRPVVGSEYLRTRQFPAEVQGQFVYACLIKMNGIPRWTISDDGAGYKGVRVRHDPADPATAFDLLKSTDKHFRPVDPQIGPDGALWFGDWANPLIGHIQYSQRDPNRDKVHGRIYRLVCKDKPLLRPETQAGRSTSEVLDQLKSPEWRTRYRARAELQARIATDVLPDARRWVARHASDPGVDRPTMDRLKMEQLWLQQSFHAIDEPLLEELLDAPTPDARAAATRVVADARDAIRGAEMRLIAKAADTHPRVRAEAVRGLSFYGSAASFAAVVAAANAEPQDRFVEYTCDAAFGAHVEAWQPAYEAGTLAARGTPAAKILERVLGLDAKSAEIRRHLSLLTSKERPTADRREGAIRAITQIEGGDPANGRDVFRRVCASCHKWGTEGATGIGPELTDVGKRLDAVKLVESIVDPSAVVDEKYLSTLIVTADGRTVTGLLVGETPEHLVIFDGRQRKTVPVAEIEERLQLKQSSMPEGLATTLAPTELLDVVEFLKGRK